MTPSEQGFCPACGEPVENDKIAHDPLCPYAGDETHPEDADGVK